MATHPANAAQAVTHYGCSVNLEKVILHVDRSGDIVHDLEPGSLPTLSPGFCSAQPTGGTNECTLRASEIHWEWREQIEAGNELGFFRDETEMTLVKKINSPWMGY